MLQEWHGLRFKAPVPATCFSQDGMWVLIRCLVCGAAGEIITLNCPYTNGSEDEVGGLVLLRLQPAALLIISTPDHPKLLMLAQQHYALATSWDVRHHLTTVQLAVESCSKPDPCACQACCNCCSYQPVVSYHVIHAMWDPC
jgi:hypothetical protein